MGRKVLPKILLSTGFMIKLDLGRGIQDINLPAAIRNPKFKSGRILGLYDTYAES
jgi:hypothetical protein